MRDLTAVFLCSLLSVGAMPGVARADTPSQPQASASPQQDPPLAIAIRERHIDVAQALVDQGAPVNVIVTYGSLLSVAISFDSHVPGGRELIESMVAHGADVNIKTPNGYSPLLTAIFQHDREIAEFLIAKGADVQEKGPGGITPFSAAMKQRDAEMADLLVQHGAKQDYVPEPPMTRFESNGVELTIPAIQPIKGRIILFRPQGDLHTGTADVQYLILQQDDCKLHDTRMEGGQLSSVDYSCHILPGGTLGGTGKQGSLQLHLTLPEGVRSLGLFSVGTSVKVSVPSGPPVTSLTLPDQYWFAIEPLPDAQASSTGPLPLNVSIKGLDCSLTVSGQGSGRCVVVVWNGANGSVQVMADGDSLKQPDRLITITLSRSGAAWAMSPASFRPFPPVMIAVMRKDPDALNKLVAAGANLDEHYPDQEAPLVVALLNHRQDMAKILVAHGADLRQQTLHGATPLLMVLGGDVYPADPAGIEELVGLMLAHGADVNQAAKNGILPLEQAALNGQASIVDMLIAKGADVNGRPQDPPLSAAISRGHLDIATTLVNHGAKMGTQDYQGDTVLLSVIRHGQGDPAQTRAFIDLLLSRGADVNKADRDGLTPLLSAVATRQPDMVALLLTKGADVNAEVNFNGRRMNALDILEMEAQMMAARGGLTAAQKAEDEKMRALLRQHGATESPASHP